MSSVQQNKNKYVEKTFPRIMRAKLVFIIIFIIIVIIIIILIG